VASSVQSEFDLDSPAPPAQLTRHFLGWDKPLLTAAVDFLCRDWQGGLLDLSHLAVVVPTRNASRRLRESLAIRAAENNSGVLPPLILNPDDLLTLEQPAYPTASKAEALTAWIEVLLSTNLADYPQLFPVAPVESNFSWALATARDFMQVQSLLGEGAHNATYAAQVLATHDLEPERWAELARLENQVNDILAKNGRQSHNATRREALEKFHLPDNCTRLLLLGLPDPPPALEPLVNRLAQQTPTEIVIHAPESEAALFDPFGRPAPDWADRPLPIAEDSIHCCANPAAQADWARNRIATHPPHQAPSRVAIGIPDPEVSAPLHRELAALSLETFDPSGRPLAGHGLCHLLQTWQALTLSKSLADFRELLRCPGVAEAAGDHAKPAGTDAFSAARMLTQFDDFNERHLATTFAAAHEILPQLTPEKRGRQLDRATLTRGLAWAQHWLQVFERKSLASALPEFLTEVYSHAGGTRSDDFQQASELLGTTLGELADASLAKRSSAEQLQLFLSLFAEQMLTAHRPEQALDLVGWLELPWEDAPHLIVTGLNDGLVPESIQGHPWLPNRARQALALRDNGQRHARDAYLLTALLASRETGGQVDLLFGRTTGREDPLRPSRLLLATDPADLPARVRLLFDSQSSEATALPWTMGWQLTPPAPAEDQFQKLNVTAFAKYLDCPFRFYLSSGLHMEALDLNRSELNARDFGNLTHRVLEDFAATAAAESSEEKEVAETFDDLLSDLLTTTYGSSRSVPLILQEEAIRQRLRWWAEHEARQRDEGWKILKVEDYLAPKDEPFTLDGMPISGMIDRIEEHPKLGLRILDFKTKKKPTPVQKAHLAKIKGADQDHDLPAWSLLDHGPKSKPHRWINLQVPLYCLALAERFPARQLVAGYVQLGQAKGDIALDLWEDLDDTLLTSARHCALGVIAAVRARKFWPPNDTPKYDDYRSLLFGDPVGAVQSSEFRVKN
jgi:ATP-dependent helicase/nuclease subunit B